MDLLLVALVVCALLALNIAATIAVTRDDLSERYQKILQLVLVWVLPCIGAIITLAVHRPTEKPSGKYRQGQDAGDDYAYSGRSQKTLSEAINGD